MAESLSFKNLADLAALSVAAYDAGRHVSGILPDGWKYLSPSELGLASLIPVTRTPPGGQRFIANGYYSFFTVGIDAEAFAAEKDGVVVIAFRGTDAFFDLQADIGIVAGSLQLALSGMSDFIDAVRTYAISKGYDLLATGHSLGGAMAEALFANDNNLGGFQGDSPPADTSGTVVGGAGFGSPGISLIFQPDANSAFLHVTRETDVVGNLLDNSHVGTTIALRGDNLDFFPSGDSHAISMYAEQMQLLVSSAAFAGVDAAQFSDPDSGFLDGWENGIYVPKPNSAVVGLGLVAESAIMGSNRADSISPPFKSGAVRIGAGEGNDVVTGGEGAELIWGDSGSDILKGEGGADRIFGGNDQDMIYGGGGDDDLRGEAADDILRGGTGADLLFGGMSSDTLYGDEGTDTLRGETDADTLFGGADNDTIYGDEGPDHLYGEAGIDIYRGGPGADTFYFDSTSLSLSGGTAELIEDYNQGTGAFDQTEGDVIDVSAMLTASGVGQSDSALWKLEQASTSIFYVDPDGTDTKHGWQAVAELKGLPQGTKVSVITDPNLSASNVSPTANDDSASAIKGQMSSYASARFLANDYDVDGDDLTIVSVTNPVNGSVKLVGSSIVFTPTSSFIGTAGFDYAVSDGKGEVDTAHVKISVQETLTTGPLNDVIGTSGADMLIGTQSADRIVSNGGKDTLIGGEGNDFIVLNAALASGAFIDGGYAAAEAARGAPFGDVDTLVFENFSNQPENRSIFFPEGVPSSSHLLLGLNISSIERLQFDSDQETLVTALLGFGGSGPYSNQLGGGKVVGNAELVGGEGSDTLVLNARLEGVGSSYRLVAPTFSYTNWETPSRAYLSGDRVVVSAGASTANLTIDGSAHAGVQFLVGGSGNDTLNGTDDMDYMQIGAGEDAIRGNGGDDTLAAINFTNLLIGPSGVISRLPSLKVGLKGLFDGGAGFDFLALGGVYEFIGEVINVEGIYLAPSYEFPTQTVGGGGLTSGQELDRAKITFSQSTLGQFPSNLRIDGEGTIIVEVAPGENFDGSGYVFETSGIDFVVHGSSSDDQFIVTTSADAVDGNLGTDIVIIPGNHSAYSARAGSKDEVLIGADSFTNTELFRFDDGVFTWNGKQLVSAEYSGRVSDGYLAGATVFVDANNNGVVDFGEPTTVTDSDGRFTLLSAVGGTLRAIGGTNTDTRLGNELTLSAPEGSTVLNPLTTLIQALVSDGATLADAEARVEIAFGLEPSLALTKLDLISSANGQAAALEGQRNAVAVAELLAAVASDGGFDATLAELSKVVGEGKAIDLSDSALLERLISAGLPGASMTEIGELGDRVQDIILAIQSSEDVDDISVIQAAKIPIQDWRLFASPGYMGEVGGSGTVFGTAAVQAIHVLDLPGSIFFDPSFNRGGDLIRLDGDAQDWFIARSGSSALLSDGDTIVSIPVGINATLISFDDGTRLLRYDAISEDMKIADQDFAFDLIGINASSAETETPSGLNQEALSRLFLSNGAGIDIGGRSSVFGTAGFERVSIEAGEFVLDPSFNRGGDALIFSNQLQDAVAYRSGSAVVLITPDFKVFIPVGTAGIVLDFAGQERVLRLDQAAGEIKIGERIVTTAPVALNERPIVEDSQSLSTAASKSINVLVSATDVDGDTLSYSIVLAPANGTLIGNSGNYIYAASEGFIGVDKMMVTVEDGNGGISSQVISVSVEPPAMTIPPMDPSGAMTFG